MLLRIVLFVLAGFAAVDGYAWKSDTEYLYQVRGRTLTSLHQVADQYAGVMLKAQMAIRRKGDGVLVAKITDAQYAQVHNRLPQGWKTQIPDSNLSYRQLKLSEKPFEIKMKNGTVKELIVEKDISNWETNMIRSFISQIQVDVQGENMIKSNYNHYSDRDATFKTMEDTVTGKCETLYEITPLPEYLLQTKPEWAPMPHLKGDGEIIEVIKTKNYTDCDERVGYHFGLGEVKEWEPTSANLADYFSKSSVSRVVVSGTMKRHTIQSSVTTNKIVLKPTPGSDKKGMVISQMNITLTSVRASSGQPETLSQPKVIGNLVYKFNDPLSTTNEAREGSRNNWERKIMSSEENDSDESSEDNSNLLQEEPTMNDSPQTPLLPYYVGYMGKSVKTAENVNIVKVVEKISEEVAHELQSPNEITREDTLAKFVNLVKLIRTMDVKELEEACRAMCVLQSKVNRNSKDQWKVFRDAVAQAGTGPAFVIVQKWIEESRIKNQEAATVLASIIHATRQPNEEYMRTVYNFIKKTEVQEQDILNSTALLSFTELAHRVYVNKEVSHSQFPIHSFGKFDRNSEIVTSEYIPYLEGQLERAVRDADSHKVLVYIRALGNLGHEQILNVYAPYLAGSKHISQFQRLFIVMSMDKLAMQNPKLARSVLYKIYQNKGELREVRIAAVYLLMRTSPPASMLQRMAESTNMEDNNDVNAAVKTVLESASKLKDPIYLKLATNAKAAVPLLNPKTYRMQYSHHYLKNYVVKEMNMVYKQSCAAIGSEESNIPQGIMYSLRANMGGLKRQFMNIHAVVSSVEDLFGVFSDQFEENKVERFASAMQQSKWSSEQISRMLNMEFDESEQLEGYVNIGMNGMKRLFTYNNHTVERLPHLLREIESHLRQGSEFNYTKLFNPYEITLSFPTVMGVPFVYSMETPTVLSLNGEIRAKVDPEVVSKNNKIRAPETVNITTEIRAVYSSKTEAKIGFITPYDHQHYIAGFDKNMQIHVPFRVNLDIDVVNQQVSAEFEPIEENEDQQLLHYSTKPYTSECDILKMETPSQSSTTKTIQVREPKHYETIVGEETGMAYRLKLSTENEYSDWRWLYEYRQHYEGMHSILAPMTEDYLYYSNLTIMYDSERSTADKMIVNVGWNKTYEAGKSNVNEESFEQIFNNVDSEDRQEHFSKKVAAGINNADVEVYDISLQFEGKKYTSYNATIAVGKSSVDEKSHILFYYNQKSENPKIRAMEVCLWGTKEIPNTNSLDYMYALKYDPTMNSQWKLAFGDKCKSGSKIELKGKLYKSEERKRYLQSTPMSQQCVRQMEQGDQQLYPCRNLTVRANYLDRADFDLSFENVSPYIRNATYKLYHYSRYLGFHNVDEDRSGGHGEEGHLKVRTRFSPDFNSVNVTVESRQIQANFDNIRIAKWVKPLVSVHPKYDVFTKYGQNPVCVMDKNHAVTFDNKTYPINLGKTWYVAMHYPSNNNYDDDFDYTILVRETGEKNKEAKIVLNNQNNYWEVELIPLSDSNKLTGKVLVNKKQIDFDEKLGYDLEEDLLKIYSLPRGEVVVEVNREYSVVYDGQRVKVVPIYSGNLRGQVRGLCGTFDGEYTTDFMTPKQCILRDPHEFASTYAIIDETSQGPAKELQIRAYKSPCYKKQVMYSNIVSTTDYRRMRQRQEPEDRLRYHTKSCMKQQTRYIDEDTIDCFTVRPMPFCLSPCSANHQIEKNVEVHCVQKSHVSQLWKQQIENGASPDFGHKPVTKTIKMRIPQSCSS